MYRRSNKTAFGGLSRKASAYGPKSTGSCCPESLRLGVKNKKMRMGFTLLEVLLALAVGVMVVGALMALSRAAAIGSAYTEGVGLTTQHGRVVLDRIARTVREANASDQFPGFIVVADQVGPWRFPDALVVWRPESTAAAPTGLPRFSELVIYCPHPQQPGWLMEIRVPDDTRTVPAITDVSAWQAELAAIKASATATAVRLTDRMRTCTSGELGERPRAALRFEARYRPSLEEYAAYKAGTIAWTAIAWPESMYGPNMGLRQAWLRIEVQLVAEEENSQEISYPFFGSVALYYPLSR